MTLSFCADQLKLYLVLDPDLCGGIQGMIDTTRLAVAAGVTTIQLRAPQWKKRLYTECARELLKITRPANVPLIINDHADVVVATQADGLHIGQSDLSVEDARQVIGPHKILGLSINTLAQCARVNNALVNYIGIGPVYATATKKDAAQAIGLAGLQAIVRMAPCPSVAIGGIKAQDVSPVMATGTHGVAIVSAICGQDDVTQATTQLLRAF